jgi:hypothetical protein
MEPIYVITIFVFVVVSLLILGAYLANQEKQKKADRKKVVEFLRSLILLFNDSSWRKNPGITNEDTAKKVIEYFKAHHIDTEFNLLMRSVSTFPKTNKYRPMTNLASLMFLDQSFCMLAESHASYKKLRRLQSKARQQGLERLQQEFFEGLELAVLDIIDPSH